MTVRELMTILEDAISLDKDFLNAEVLMVGHDANGERKWDIKVQDATHNYGDMCIRFWDN